MGWVHELIHVNLIADFFDLIVNNISLLSIGTIWQENPRHYFKHNIGIYISSQLGYRPPFLMENQICPEN